MELSDKDFRVIMLNTFKEIKGKVENLGRELEIIKKNIPGLELHYLKLRHQYIN